MATKNNSTKAKAEAPKETEGNKPKEPETGKAETLADLAAKEQAGADVATELETQEGAKPNQADPGDENDAGEFEQDVQLPPAILAQAQESEAADPVGLFDDVEDQNADVPRDVMLMLLGAMRNEDGEPGVRVPLEIIGDDGSLTVGHVDEGILFVQFEASGSKVARAREEAAELDKAMARQLTVIGGRQAAKDRAAGQADTIIPLKTIIASPGLGTTFSMAMRERDQVALKELAEEFERLKDADADDEQIAMRSARTLDKFNLMKPRMEEMAILEGQFQAAKKELAVMKSERKKLEPWLEVAARQFTFDLKAKRTFVII